MSILIQLPSKEDELIISDDGSSDGTKELVKKLQKTDSRIRTTHGPGKGVIKNFEHALSMAKVRIYFFPIRMIYGPLTKSNHNYET